MKLPVMNPLVRMALAAAVSAGTSAHATTIITMNAGGSARLNGGTFGSNIPATPPNSNFTTIAGAAGTIGTPDISLLWGGGLNWDQYGGWDGRGTVIQAETYDSSQTLTLDFNPSDSTAVVLQSADFDNWAGGNLRIAWSVTGTSSGTLASGVWTRNTGGRELMPFNATGALGETITLKLTNTGGATGSYFAIDNLTFDQVPEPSVVVLGGAGLGALALRRRRNRV